MYVHTIIFSLERLHGYVTTFLHTDFLSAVIASAAALTFVQLEWIQLSPPFRQTTYIQEKAEKRPPNPPTQERTDIFPPLIGSYSSMYSVHITTAIC